jgi:hypothetical protein
MRRTPAVTLAAALVLGGAPSAAAADGLPTFDACGGTVTSPVGRRVVSYTPHVTDVCALLAR